MSPSLTLDDVLDVDYPGAAEWSAHGRFLAAPVYEDDGQALQLVDTDTGDDWRVRPESGFVTEFAWAPEARPATCAVVTDGGETLLLDAADRTTRRLATAPDGDASLTWSNGGDRIALYRDGRPTVVSIPSGETRTVDAPERGPYLGESRMFAWSDDDDRLAYRFVDRETKQVGVVDVEAGDLVWRTANAASSSDPVWLADGRVVYDETEDHSTVRRLVAADPETGERTTLLTEEDRENGVVSQGSPRVSPDGTRLALCLPVDGWDHVHVVDGDGERIQLTAGEFEDKGLADSVPRWLDDDRLVFASNRNDPGQRHLFAVRARGEHRGEVEPLVETQGSNVHPRPSPDGDRVAYVHADRTRSAELRVHSLDGDPASAGTAVTTSEVAEWPVDPVEPELVSVESSDGWEIPGYLLDPRDSAAVADDATDLPAVIWVHGGPMRQMRDGWHPGRSYGLPYTFHQYLATRGYVGLCVNYRGGIGYGKEFRQGIAEDPGSEMNDVVAAAEYLKRLDYVDEESVAIWGLSYGGYATLQILGTDPDVFTMGVNLAGVADRRVYEEWATHTKYPEAVSRLPHRLGGHPWEAPEAWDEASPVTHMDAVDAPLYNFHGTADRYVNFEQLDEVVDRLLDRDGETDAVFEWEYYPDENHVFSERRTWERTLRQIVEAFENHL
jgi:dipeptidyl aminopeptidase/acylaminoacyl peptidase